MLIIFYSPHMTSSDNETGRASGHADVPLTVAGQERAWQLGQHYATIALDAVFSSDLQRATTTARIVCAGRDLPLVSDSRLREYDYGDMTQYPVAQVEQEFPLCITEPFPNGESLFHVVQRMGAFLRDTLRTYDGKTILVIGHRATRYGLIYWCEHLSLENIVEQLWKWREVPIWRFELNAHDLKIQE